MDALNEVPASFACPGCDERDMDNLVWQEDGEYVVCSLCGTCYDPLTSTLE